MNSESQTCNSTILCGDVGGTNTNLALVRKSTDGFSLILDRHYKTKEEKSLIAPVRKFLAEAAMLHPSVRPELCCISGAGVLVGRTIDLTNASWSIDGDLLEAELGIHVVVINDFTAISYGILLLDPENPEQIERLPHTNGRIPELKKGVRAIIGAGTGLGVAYVVVAGNKSIVMASEGGHTTLPVYDDETRAFQAWLEKKYGFTPGAEAGISGQGIANLFEFFVQSTDIHNPSIRTIFDAPFTERPALIAAASLDNPVAAHAMDVFVKLFARKAADLCATFLPAGGIFLAGGIAAKNASWFTEGNRFIEMFEQSYTKHIRNLLAETPVMIVKDYSISLYGAANAAITL